MKKYLDNLRQYQFLLSELVKKGIKLKYRRSYLGILWSMLEPLLSMVVLTIVFGTLYGNTDKTFPVYILSGRLLYSFYSSATKAALKSIRSNAAMIKKVYVPKYLYPLSTVIYNYIIFLISLVVLAIVGVILGVKPTIYLLQAPVALIIILILSYGSGMFLATIGVFFRDIEYLWSVALMLISIHVPFFYYPKQAGEEWLGQIPEVQSSVLYHSDFPICNIRRAYVCAICNLCSCIQRSDYHHRTCMLQEKTG